MNSHRADAKNVKMRKGIRTRSVRFMFGYRMLFFLPFTALQSSSLKRINIVHMTDPRWPFCVVSRASLFYRVIWIWLCEKRACSSSTCGANRNVWWSYNSKHTSFELDGDSRWPPRRRPVYTHRCLFSSSLITFGSWSDRVRTYTPLSNFLPLDTKSFRDNKAKIEKEDKNWHCLCPMFELND